MGDLFEEKATGMEAGGRHTIWPEREIKKSIDADTVNAFFEAIEREAPPFGLAQAFQEEAEKLGLDLRSPEVPTTIVAICKMFDRMYEAVEGVAIPGAQIEVAKAAAESSRMWLRLVATSYLEAVS